MAAISVEQFDLVALIGAPAWMRDAACAEYRDHADDWFPERGRANAAVKRAKRVCSACLVRAECLHFALEENIVEGVWGGCTAAERRSFGALG